MKAQGSRGRWVAGNIPAAARSRRLSGSPGWILHGVPGSGPLSVIPGIKAQCHHQVNCRKRHVIGENQPASRSQEHAGPITVDVERRSQSEFPVRQIFPSIGVYDDILRCTEKGSPQARPTRAFRERQPGALCPSQTRDPISASWETSSQPRLRPKNGKRVTIEQRGPDRISGYRASPTRDMRPMVVKSTPASFIHA
jgi:hypothetical protein